MNDICTESIIDQPEARFPETPVRKRRLKGLLALLPESGTLYCDQRIQNNNSNNNNSSLEQNVTASKITSRKQQRRRLKRHEQEKLKFRSSADLFDVESGNYNELNDANSNVTIPTATLNVTIHLADLVHENDIVVLFLFDAYQPYSLQLLKKLFSLCGLPNESYEVGTEATIVDNMNARNQSKLHCFVVTSCTDTTLIDRLLENTGVILLPWANDYGDGGSSDYWKIAMGGANLCPSILAIIECSKGRNIFPINHEELALDWNTSIHVQNSWLRQRKSAFTTLQRIQTYALYPTTSLCTIH